MFKIITLSAALNENLIDLDNDYFHDSGSVKVGGVTIHFWKHGGTVAAPIAREVMKSIIDTLDIKPDKNGIEKEDNFIDKKYIIVPDVVGMDFKDAKKELKGFDIKMEGKGKIYLMLVLR